MPKKRIFTQEQIDDIISRYQNHEYIKYIAKVYNCTHGPITRILVEHNIKIRTITYKFFFSKEQIYNIIDLYKVNITLKYISKKYNCSNNVIQRTLKENGITKKQHEYVLENSKKICSKCNIVKPLSEFSKCSTSKYNHKSACKECMKLYYNENIDIIKEYLTKNKERILKNHKEYYKENKNNIRIKANKAKKTKKYKDIRKKYITNKYNNNVNYKLTILLRGRILSEIKGKYKSASTLKLLGCTIEEFKIHLQKTADDRYPDKKFDINNYDSKLWHIDHIKPCSSFNLEDPEEQKKCFNWSNLQILTAEDNMSKGNR